MNVYRMVEAEGWIVTSAETYWAVWKPSNRRQDWLALMHRSKFVSAPTLDALLQQLPPSVVAALHDYLAAKEAA